MEVVCDADVEDFVGFVGDDVDEGLFGHEGS